MLHYFFLLGVSSRSEESSELSANLLSCQSLSAHVSLSSPACFIWSLLSVITHRLWVIVEYFTAAQLEDLRIRHKHKNLLTLHLYLYFMLPSIFSPHPLFDTCTCFEHVSCFYLLTITPPANPFLWCPHIILLSSLSRILFYSLLGFHSFPLLLAHGSSSPFLWLFHLFLLPLSLFSSPPSFRISTSDEQQGGDCSASLLSHFMVWLKKWDGGESDAERRELRQTSGGSNTGESWNKEKTKENLKKKESSWIRESAKGMFVYYCLCSSMIGKLLSQAALQTV